MKKVEYQITINATAQKVWQTMWFHQTYKKWTNIFCDGSYYKGELIEGNKIQFLTPNGSGMYSCIDSLKPNEYIAFKHLGEVKNFEEQPSENFAWSGALETYTLIEENGTTTIKAIHDAAPEFEEWFANTFPKALQAIKVLAEQPVAITVETIVNAGIEKIWNYFTQAQHIEKWYNASDDWHTPKATNNLIVDGSFNYRMEAKDGSFGFDFGGTYTIVKPNKKLEYILGDGRKVTIDFIKQDNGYRIAEKFEAEEMNSLELQQGGWQAILNNFKKYAEAN